MLLPHNNQIKAHNQYWCSACGRKTERELIDQACNNPAGRHTSLSPVCDHCAKRAKAAKRNMADFRRHAQSALPSLRLNRATSPTTQRGAEGPERKIKRQTINGRSCSTLNIQDDQHKGKRGIGIPRTNLLTVALIATVRQGNRTVCHLKQPLDDELAYVKEQGVHNVEPGLLMVMNALDNAIQWIEIERAGPHQRRDN